MSPEAAVREWVEGFVVKLGLCPFAARPLREGRVTFVACDAEDVEEAFYWAGAQVQGFLEADPAALDTELLVFTSVAADFDDFLDLVEEVEFFLERSGADALVQLAHFHPAYRFAGAPATDPANATNRSPWPVIQLLRVESVARAIDQYPDVKGIPERNAALLREWGRAAHGTAGPGGPASP